MTKKMSKNDKKWQKITKNDKKLQKMTKNDKNGINDKMTKKKTNKETERVAQYLNIFLYQASIISSRWIISLK